MGKRLNEEARLKVVREALAGVKVGALARMYDIHPETVRNWIRDHRDDIKPNEIPEASEHLQELKRLQEIEAKYEKAMKILGEKELENEILRELIKKRNPAYPKSTK
ncbi:transposase [Paenibacillus apiarius]|uniref:Helix-turn-helix domain-containing protein n=1 Tax=Paenibacillus apiarius TaxID=46240 RepID=A0ABT4E1D7_9BACL|nr:transposase [Paenibacillus apiarius]MCY9513865.1 helix-turn-helix domain-containing protein [Paenibacillus apiarius]MCY9523416.1 helix-turn-helix domain-containing protein [Paenibacillus apiarius]MCY9554508.1 helix-turn-helix domain-containing protein [Paenibacillus apiarius]MCY9561636.1 helix-turn-helix domain-containing protein [Paenibacillus apiarius]MCY9687175.1 helix-turn-helix domain-containing protein [Paenibacillus apiarius]